MLYAYVGVGFVEDANEDGPYQRVIDYSVAFWSKSKEAGCQQRGKLRGYGYVPFEHLLASLCHSLHLDWQASGIPEKPDAEGAEANELWDMLLDAGLLKVQPAFA